MLSFDPAIRRRPDGSIDTEHYVSRARALRSLQAQRFLSAVLPQDASREIERSADQDARHGVIGHDGPDRL